MSPAGFEVVQVRAMGHMRFAALCQHAAAWACFAARGGDRYRPAPLWLGRSQVPHTVSCRSCLQHEFPVRGHPSTPFAVATAVMLKHPDPDGHNGIAAREPVLLIAALADIGVTGALLVCQCRACLHQQHLCPSSVCA